MLVLGCDSVTVLSGLDVHSGVATGLDVSDVHLWVPRVGALQGKVLDVQECLRIQPGWGHRRCSVGLGCQENCSWELVWGL